MLSRDRHTALGAEPAVLVVDLGGAEVRDPGGLVQVLGCARERARLSGICLSFVDRDQPAIHQQLLDAGVAVTSGRD